MYDETESEEVNAVKIDKGGMDKTADYDDCDRQALVVYAVYKSKMTASGCNT